MCIIFINVSGLKIKCDAIPIEKDMYLPKKNNIHIFFLEGLYLEYKI